MLPEPDLVNEAVPVPLHEVVNRVQPDKPVVLRRDDVWVPENGGHVESDLEEHRYDLAEVLEEYDHRRGQPREPQHEYDHGEEVVDELQGVYVRIMAVREKHEEDEQDEEEVYDQAGEDLDDREDADAEDHLLYDEGVLDDGACPVVDAVAEEEKECHPRDEPEYVRVVVHRLGFEADLEDEPEDEDVDCGEDKGPDDAEVGTEVYRLEVPFGQFVYDIPAGKKFRQEIGKHSEAMHGR